jgi:hypothetical protein
MNQDPTFSDIVVALFTDPVVVRSIIKNATGGPS